MKINLLAPINELGYGQVGLNVLKGLQRIGQEVALFPIGGTPNVSHEDHPYLVEAIHKQAQFPDFDAPSIRIWHQHDMSQFVGRGPKIGFPIFELDTFTPQEKYHLSNLDHIFVCSEWAKRIVIKEVPKIKGQTAWSDDLVDVVPLGVDLHELKDYPSFTGGPTKFFTCGKWEIRKGHDVLIDAFNHAFKEEDDVELHMMCTNPFLTPEQDKEWKNKYINSKLGHKVRFVNRVRDHIDVIKIMNQMDAGVFISRAEGWNLELLEMMALGKPVIATNYSAHTEFCNNSNSYLVDIDELEKAQDGIWFKGQGDWAKLGDRQLEQIVEHMRTIHRKKSSGRLLVHNNMDGYETGLKLTWDNTANEIITHLSNI